MIVNTVSGAGDKGIAGQAAKYGVIGLTKAAALDRINAVCLGIYQYLNDGSHQWGTAEGRERLIVQEPIGRMGKPEEIAATVIWLCSDADSFVVGHAMVVDGGQTV